MVRLGIYLREMLVGLKEGLAVGSGFYLLGFSKLSSVVNGYS